MVIISGVGTVFWMVGIFINKIKKRCLCETTKYFSGGIM
nr:MAG TPA: hypothetical protein [Caudoviricetes sp.]